MRRATVPGAAHTFETASGDETHALGRRLGALLQAGDVVLLEGGLGAGKTTFAHGIGDALGVTSPVTSPTFTLIHEYATAGPPLFHVDPYRLASEDDLEGIGFEDYLEREGVLVVEWAERLGALTPDDAVVVTLAVRPDGGRTVTVASTGPRSEHRLAALTAPVR